MTVIAFDDSVELKLLDASCPDEPVMDEIVNTNQHVNLPALDPGDYRLEVYSVGKLATQRGHSEFYLGIRWIVHNRRTTILT